MDQTKKIFFIKHKYKNINQWTQQKKVLLDSRSQKYKLSKQLVQNLDNCINTFRCKIKQGPYYICSVCNRLLYKKSVMLLNQSKYTNVPKSLFTDTKSFDDQQYICKTCHSKVLKGIIPCQAVCNNMYVKDILAELASLEKLEQILIAQRIVFEKIIIMAKGQQQKKVKGAICNVPVECDETCTFLPRPPERSGIIMLKLKRKLEFRGHVYFQAVRSQFILDALNWLKMNNPLYSNIKIDINNISVDLTSLEDDCVSIQHFDKNEKPSIDIDKNKIMNNDDTGERDDPLNEHRQATSQTCLQSVLPD